MVRILKVKELQDRKRELRARSEIYRQTLALEVTNVRLSVALLKKQMRGLKTVTRLFGLVVPVSGLIFGRRKKAEGKSGFLTQLLSGLNLATQLKKLFGGEKAVEPEPGLEPEEAGTPARH